MNGPLPEPSGPAPAAGTGGENLARAVRELRGRPEPGWGEVAGRLQARLRTVSRPGRPLTVHEDGAGRVQVDTRVVVDAVRRAVGALPGVRPVGISVGSERAVPTSVVVAVEVAYGVDVLAAADTVRSTTRAVALDLLAVTLPVDVEVVDVVPG